MAYNYYQPMGYAPQTYAPQMPNPQPQLQQAAYANTGIVWVNDYNEAAMYPIAPNAAVALWDKNNPCIYLKQADSTGKPSLKIYDLVERKPQTSGEARYASLEAFERLSKTVDGIILQLNNDGLKSSSTALGGEAENNG